MILKVKKLNGRWYYHDAWTIVLGDTAIEVIYRKSKYFINKNTIKEAYILNDKGQTIERLRF